MFVNSNNLISYNSLIKGELFLLNLHLLIMKLFIITFTLLALAFAGIAIKIWAKKGGEFSGTCASQNPFLNKDNETCSYCGKLPSEQNCRPNPQHN